MKLGENSLKLIKILNSDPKKLSKFHKIKDSEQSFAYVQTLIPNYTQEEFKNFELFISKLQKLVMSNDLNNINELKEEELENISGGSFKDWVEILNEFNSGYNNNPFDPLAKQLAISLKELLKESEQNDEDELDLEELYRNLKINHN